MVWRSNRTLRTKSNLPRSAFSEKARDKDLGYGWVKSRDGRGFQRVATSLPLLWELAAAAAREAGRHCAWRTQQSHEDGGRITELMVQRSEIDRKLRQAGEDPRLGPLRAAEGK